MSTPPLLEILSRPQIHGQKIALRKGKCELFRVSPLNQALITSGRLRRLCLRLLTSE
jgi:hypothetical protein